MLALEGTTALVTGGHRGIGRALVDELLARGAAKVYATSRTLQVSTDPRVVPLALDVTDPASVAAAAQVADDVALVINNAGVNNVAALLDGPMSGVRADLETNLLGLLEVSRAFAPALAKHESSALLNVLSAVSWYSYGFGYDVSKAAAWSATNGLRTALAAQGTSVTGLHVGLVDTDMAKGFDAPKSDPRDVARLALDGVEEGAWEVLADEHARTIKAGLSGPAEELYATVGGFADV